MTSYDDMPKEIKEKLDEILAEKFSESNIDLSEIKIDDEKNDKVTFKSGGIAITVPAPDKKTTNDIWKFLAGGAVALAGIAVANKILKDNS